MLILIQMKPRSTTPTVSKISLRQIMLVALAVLVAASSATYMTTSAFARDYESEIRAKQQEADQYSNEAGRLEAVADTLEGELNRLSEQIATIQAQIQESEKRHRELVEEIARNQALIEQNREALGTILSDMYVDDQISPLEMLASSKSIGDYIDKQEQRSALREALNDKIKGIKELQAKLEENKQEVERILVDQKSQRSQVAERQQQQQTLLAVTQNDQANYQKLAAERNAEITQLQEQQRRANCEGMGGIWSGGTCQSRSGGSSSGAFPPASFGNGGYPAIWANAPLNTYVDTWGLYSRQCVSYTAWKVASSGRYVPHFAGMGNANQWPATAARHGIPSGSTPKVGSVAMWPIGYYGHTMYVEAVNGDGTITVSDYNLAWDGQYRYYTRSAAGLTYIYF